MVIYEVTARVDLEAADDYRRWLEDHVREILRIDGFDYAVMSELEEVEAGRRGFVASYYLTSREALDSYLENHAAALRADAEKHFGGRFAATRRVHTILAEMRAG